VARVPTATSGKSQAAGGSGRLSSPLPFCTGGEKQGHLQSQEKMQQPVDFSSLFRSAFILFFFCLLLLSSSPVADLLQSGCSVGGFSVVCSVWAAAGGDELGLLPADLWKRPKEKIC